MQRGRVNYGKGGKCQQDGWITVLGGGASGQGDHGETGGVTPMKRRCGDCGKARGTSIRQVQHGIGGQVDEAIMTR